MDSSASPEAMLWRKAIERQIDGLHDSLTELQARFDESDLRQSKLLSDTAEVLAILRDWKGLVNVLKWVSMVVVPIGAIFTALAAVVGTLKLLGLW